MAESEARVEAAPAAARPVARPTWLWIGPTLAAGLGLLALMAAGAAEFVLLAVLGALAVAGAFLVLGLATGYLRFGERIATAETVEAIADGLDTGLQIVNRHGRVVYRNRALQRLAGRRAGQHTTLEELFAGEPASAQAFFRLNRAAERGEPWEEEFQVRAGSGAGRWLRVTVRRYPPAHTRPSAGPMTLWQVGDVTRERNRELETLSGLEATLAYYDALPQGLLAVAPDGRIVHCNGTLAHWLRLRPEPGRSLTLLDIVPADGAALIRAVSRAREGRPARIELDLLREDGRAFPAELICRVQAVGGIISVLVLERGEEAASHAAQSDGEARLKRMVHSAPFGIATVDAEGRLITANAAFLRMFTVEGQPVPVSITDLLPEKDEETARLLQRALERALSGRSGGAPIEVAFGPQQEFARRLYVTPLGTGARGRTGAVFYAIDATEQKALELKFAQSHKMEAVGKLAGGVAHDFNNVLTAIIGFSDLLLQTHRPTDAAYRDIMNIRSSANRAADLVQQLLAFSRRQTLQPKVLELGEVLTDLAPLLNRSLGETIELKILPGRDLWYVKADKGQFVQVIINLAVNAKDAMPDGGCLTIRTRNISERESVKLGALNLAAGEYVLIEVEDTGVGIAPEVMSKIFEPFFTTKDVGKGTGLGLSTVYGIVKQTGGYVSAESEVGRGTTFRVYLPRHIVEYAEEIEPLGADKKGATRDLTGTGRVLLVEDEDSVRNFAARALSRQGYEVLEAGTGVEAIEVMDRENGKVDIVVSDVIMPEMDGPSLLKELRKGNPQLKFIFVSGYPDDAFKKSLDDNEAYAFLPKPFTLPQLAAKVKEQLGR